MPRSDIKPDPVKYCENCGVLLSRKRINGRLEDYGVFLRRRNCSQACANSRKEVQDDSHRWRARQILKRDKCEECGTSLNLHVHHKDRDPSNNSLDNLTVLCSSHHLKLHWREDREKRLAAMRRGSQVGVPSDLNPV